MLEDSKNIKIELDYSDKDGNRSKKEMSVKVNTAILKDKNQPTYYKTRLVYTLTFSLKIPDHIHSVLINKTVPRFGISQRSETKTYENDFPKTITSATIEQLTECWCDIIFDYEWLKNDEVQNYTKVIFYGFESNSQLWTSRYNGMNFGSKNNIGYNFAIGYIVPKNDKTIRFNCDKKAISDTNDREFYSLKYVEYTEERVLFFENIQKSFEQIIDKISMFNQDLSENTINTMLNNKLLG